MAQLPVDPAPRSYPPFVSLLRRSARRWGGVGSVVGFEAIEAWLLGKDGELVALGSFKVGKEGKKSIELPLPANPAIFRYFDVSIQPYNGSPDHSGRSVLRGLTTY